MFLHSNHNCPLCLNKYMDLNVYCVEIVKIGKTNRGTFFIRISHSVYKSVSVRPSRRNFFFALYLITNRLGTVSIAY